jgi:hydrogenase expression/formation protein HypC
MCLGVPGRVIEVDGGGMTALVDFWGVRRQIRLDVVDEPVSAGDYVLNHVGYAIRRIPECEIATTLALYEELLAAVKAERDPMVLDVRGEIEAAGNGGGAGSAGRKP